MARSCCLGRWGLQRLFLRHELGRCECALPRAMRQRPRQRVRRIHRRALLRGLHGMRARSPHTATDTNDTDTSSFPSRTYTTGAADTSCACRRSGRRVRHTL